MSAEAADICARIGAWENVVAVSAYAEQTGLPRRAVVSGFSTGDAARIAALAPDLVVTFSDVQAELAAQLIRASCTVLATNQRTLAEVADAIRLIGRAANRTGAAEELAADFTRELDHLRSDAEPRPRVYFEEWPDPLISGIGWVGEIIESCGGKASRERGVESPEVIAANPDVILASWCGKLVEPARIRERPGWNAISAARDGEIHVLDSADILQPGPRLLAGARAIRRILDAYFDRGSLYPSLGFKAGDIKKADAILIGHGHHDHMSDAASVGARTTACVIASLHQRLHLTRSRTQRISMPAP